MAGSPVSPALLWKQVERIVFGQRGHARPTTKSDISAEEKNKNTAGERGSGGGGEESSQDISLRSARRQIFSSFEPEALWERTGDTGDVLQLKLFMNKVNI